MMQQLRTIITTQLQQPSTLFKQLTPRLSGRCPLCHAVCIAGSFCHACEDDILNATAQHQNRCPRCLRALKGLEFCEACYLSKPHYDSLTIGFDYVNPMKSLLLRYKNAGQLSLARPFAKLLQAQLIRQEREFPSASLCLPLPASEPSLQRRGYNPAAELARALAKLNNWQLSQDTLRREQSQTYIEQKALDSVERRLNVRQLYYCAHRLEESEVILIDDIMTSGATLDSASQALKAAGVKRVHCIVLARASHRY